MPAAVLAMVLCGLGRLAGWAGVDMAAQMYRVDSFRQFGFRMWDPSWYGGHWTLDYSVLYPPVAATVGPDLLAVLSAGVAALAFDRIARSALGPGGRAASYLFAAGTLVQASIGQLTFLAGEAVGLVALWLAVSPALPRSRRAAPAAALAVACALTSPLAGAFLALLATAWAVPAARRAGRDTGRLAVAAALALASALPVLLIALLFPGDGAMPYPLADYLWELLIAAAVAALAGPRRPAVVAGSALVAAAATFAAAVPSSLGGNVGRIEDVAALPLAVAFAWPRAAGARLPRFPRYPHLRLLTLLTAVPLALSQWAPAWGAMTSIPASSSTRPTFYQPLVQALSLNAGDGPPGRVEVVPTAYHWESAYVAPVMPLARGWERQLDVADNPVFYRPGALTPAAYRQWLLDNGVRFVALPNAPLDMAGQAEGALIGSGRVPGLVPLWSSPDWRLFAVAGSQGIVAPPGRLISGTGTDLLVSASQGGNILVRVRYSPGWSVTQGDACLMPTPDGWMDLAVTGPGVVGLGVSVLGSGTPCPDPEAQLTPG